MKNKKMYIGLILLCIINFAAHLFFYPALPDIIPTHWGFDGKVNGWGPKYTTLFLCAMPLIVTLIMMVIPKIDPRTQNFKKFDHIYRGFTLGITIFLCAITWLGELTVFKIFPDNNNLVSILVLCGIGVMFIVLGNYMPRIKQNYFFGCRTPWALNNEHNWNRTQRMGGIVFIIIGIILLISGIFSNVLGENGILIVILVPIFAGVAWVYLYSYLVFIGKMK